MQARIDINPVVDKTIELLQTHGWIQGAYGNKTTGYCLIGAIDAANHLLHTGKPAYVCSEMFTAIRRKSEIYMGLDSSLSYWNDAPGRTLQEVLALLLSLKTK